MHLHVAHQATLSQPPDGPPMHLQEDHDRRQRLAAAATALSPEVQALIDQSIGVGDSDSEDADEDAADAGAGSEADDFVLSHEQAQELMALEQQALEGPGSPTAQSVQPHDAQQLEPSGELSYQEAAHAVRTPSASKEVPAMQHDDEASSRDASEGGADWGQLQGPPVVHLEDVEHAEDEEDDEDDADQPRVSLCLDAALSGSIAC